MSKNPRLVDKTNIHKQMMMIWHAIMLDLLADRNVTVKDWSRQAEKDDRQARRAREYQPHMVQNTDGTVYLVTRKPDGTTITPLKIVRKDPKDKRCQQITTSYSSPALFRDDFDLKRFADYSYMVRQRRFWVDALKGLSRWMENGNAIRRDGEWIVRHMVNNDIAMHVIFDNLSLEFETRWFEKLSEGTRYKIAGRLNTEWEMVQFTKKELESSLNELRDSFVTDMKPPPGVSCAWQKDGKEIPLDFDGMKMRFEAYLGIIDGMAKANGGLRHPNQTLEYVPHPLAAKDAAKAVDEMAAFVADFEKNVPGNLQKYMIRPDKIDHRMRDIIQETIAILGLSDWDDERSAANAMLQRYCQLFVRSRHKSDS